MTGRYFEDFEVGEVFLTRGVTVTESMIIDFACRYDPQPIHMDAEAAKATHFNGLIASGFQTLVLAGRLFLSEQIFATTGMGSPGMDEVRWLLPVRPGDTLHVKAEILSSRPSSSRTDRGYVGMIYRVYNQKDDLVMSYKVMQIIARRQDS